MLKTIAIATGLSLLAVVAASIVGVVALEVLPCSWFGSTFEGSCAYGAFYIVSAASLVLAVGLAVAFNVLYFRKRARAAERRA
jgi:hypothetical protein